MSGWRYSETTRYPIESCVHCEAMIQLKEDVWRHIRSLEIDGNKAVQSPILCNPGFSNDKATPRADWERWTI